MIPNLNAESPQWPAASQSKDFEPNVSMPETFNSRNVYENGNTGGMTPWHATDYENPAFVQSVRFEN